jgi:hypothetical protein
MDLRDLRAIRPLILFLYWFKISSHSLMHLAINGIGSSDRVGPFGEDTRQLSVAFHDGYRSPNLNSYDPHQFR